MPFTNRKKREPRTSRPNITPEIKVQSGSKENSPRAKFLSTSDLANEYWQVEVEPKDREKTAFATSQGLFEFKVLPFGLCNWPATLQRLMDSTLAGIQWSACLVYLDDVIVFSRTFEEHVQRLKDVFRRF